MPPDPEDAGRFDLPAPRGTCYLALDEVTAVLEYLGPEWAGGGVISRDFFAGRGLYALDLHAPLRLANLTSERAVGYRVTSELATMAHYTVPQSWAAAFADAGFDGILYRPRFNTSANARSVALFGPIDLEIAAEHGFEDDLFAQLARLGIQVLAAPSLREFGL